MESGRKTKTARKNKMKGTNRNKHSTKCQRNKEGEIDRGIKKEKETKWKFKKQ